jgi:hypothetical protein
VLDALRDASAFRKALKSGEVNKVTRSVFIVDPGGFETCAW